MQRLFSHSRLSVTLALCRTAGSVSTLCRASWCTGALVTALEVADVVAAEVFLGNVKFSDLLCRKYLAVLVYITFPRFLVCL